MGARDKLLGIDIDVYYEAFVEGEEKWDKGTRAERRDLKEALAQQFPLLDVVVKMGVNSVQEEREGANPEAAEEVDRALTVSAYALAKCIKAQEGSENGPFSEQ